MPSVLFSPLIIGPVTIPNRIAVSPMCQYSAVDGNATDWHMQHLSQLAISCAGLIMVEATAVERDGRITHGCLGLFSDENERSLKRVLDIATSFSKNSIFGIQLAHAGRKASAQKPWEGRSFLLQNQNPWQTIAPSAIPYDKEWPTPKEMTLDEIERIKNSFVLSAQRAVKIGFQVIEIHAAHGYLLHEFLSPISNTRQDQYGGSLENRMRLPLEIVAAIKAVLPPTVCISARITGTDWDENGIHINEASEFASQLKQKGVSYVCVSTGGIHSKLSIPTGPCYQVPFAEKVRHGAHIITRAVGLIKKPQEAAEIIESGKADFVALARVFLDDPRWVWHAADAFGVDIDCPPQYALARPPKWVSTIQ